MPDWIQPVSSDVAANMALSDWIARIPQNIANSIESDTVTQWIVIPSL